MQFTAAFTDPVAIAASVGTEGVAAPVIYSNKVSKVGRALRAGLSAAAVNSAVDGYLISQDPLGEWKDLAYSASAGFLLGSASGAFRKSPAEADFVDQVRKVEKAGGSVSGTPGPPGQRWQHWCEDDAFRYGAGRRRGPRLWKLQRTPPRRCSGMSAWTSSVA